MSQGTATKSKSKEVKQSEKPEKPKLTKEQKRAQREAELAKLLPFRSTVGAEHLNSEGLLTTPDVLPLGYDEKKHKPLEKSDFASPTVWATYRARELRAKAARMIAAADRLEAEAATEAQFGDPAKRQQVKRLQKLLGAVGELTEILKGEGVDVDAITAALAKKA